MEARSSTGDGSADEATVRGRIRPPSRRAPARTTTTRGRRTAALSPSHDSTQAGERSGSIRSRTVPSGRSRPRGSRPSTESAGRRTRGNFCTRPPERDCRTSGRTRSRPASRVSSPVTSVRTSINPGRPTAAGSPSARSGVDRTTSGSYPARAETRSASRTIRPRRSICGGDPTGEA
jgi:hypothetical protein